MQYKTEPTDCRDSWYELSNNRQFCKTHGKTFKSLENCPLTTHLKEIISITKKVVNKHKLVVKNQGMVVKLYEDGCKQVDLAKRFSVSQQYISRIIRSMRSPNGGRERFHNYSVTFNAQVPYDYVDLPEVKLRGWSYRKYKDDEFFIQVMRDKVLVRYLKDIIGLKIHTSEDSAIQRIKELLGLWNVYHIQFFDYIVSSGHNEFMNSPIARDVASKGQRIRYRDRVDGKIRTTVDFSKTDDNPSGAPMFEHEHNKHFVSDSDKWEGIIDDVAMNNYDPLHITKAKVDFNDSRMNHVVDVLDKYATQMDKHLDVENRTADKLERDAQIQEATLDVLREMKDEMKNRSMESRRDKARKLLSDWGW